MAEKKTQPGELLQGTLDLLILKALAGGAMHGTGWSCVAYCRRSGACRITTGARNITR
jgi:hypothetical protein